MPAANRYTLAFLTAHPDDETFMGAVAIREAVEQGHRVVLLLATDGEAGKSGRLQPMERPELAALRRQEMARAAAVLGVAEVRWLGHPDGGLAAVAPGWLRAQAAQFMRETAADVVVTFPEDGISGHKDHTAIHHAVREAVHAGECPSVRKLYYAASPPLLASGHLPAVRIDVAPRWPLKRAALLAHESQILSIERVFGPLGDASTIEPRMREEQFVLAWADGVSFPVRSESSLFDGLG
ncbi:PIG-L deacetylase family protein [Paenibacillus koleovorans]|uniref:PIG-L deacetylase family protein n=1 Tax=Paenibacillus koleovorans TaxID=121608 RepID=UPI000FD8728F|nr:PIG-L family deacetylase [Paenibacillus koleovorans]